MQRTKIAVRAVQSLSKISIFNGVTEQTLYLIVHEISEERTFPAGTTLCIISRRSAFAETKKAVPSSVAEDDSEADAGKKLLSTCENSLGAVKVFGSQLVSESDGFYAILEGKCTIKNTRDGYTVGTLQTGEFFGESEFLFVMGYNYFGDIVTTTPCKFHFIPREKLRRIPEYDQKRMKENCNLNKANLTKLVFTCAEKYGGNPYEIRY